VLGIVENRIDVGHLHHFTQVHDHDVVHHLRDDAQVVRDEYDGHPQFILQLAHERQNLGLRRYVQGGRRLVRDQQTGAAGQRHGDHGALAHAAAQLMRIAIDRSFRLRHPNLVQNVDRLCPRLLLVDFLVQQNRFNDLVANRMDGAERRHRLLKDHRDLAAANRARLRTHGVDLGHVNDLLGDAAVLLTLQVK